MSSLGMLLKKELRKLAADEIQTLTNELRKEVARLKRMTEDHERRLHGLDGLKSNDGHRRLGRRAPAITKIRTRLGISKGAMAQLLGVHRNTVHRLETKKSVRMRLSMLKALSQVAHMTRAEAIRKLGGKGRSRATDS